MNIQLKRGPSNARILSSQIPKAGQLFIETDTKNLYAGNGKDLWGNLAPLYPANLYYRHQIIIRADGRGQSEMIKSYPFVELILQIDLPYDAGKLNFNFDPLKPSENQGRVLAYTDKLQEGGQELTPENRVLGYNLNQLLHHSCSGSLEVGFRSRLDGTAKVVPVLESHTSPNLGINKDFTIYGAYPGAPVNEVLYLDVGKGWLLRQLSKSFMTNEPGTNMALTPLDIAGNKNIVILQIEDSICY